MPPRPPQTAAAVVRFHDLPDMDGIAAVEGRGVDADFVRHVHGSHVVGVVDEGTRLVEAGGVETVIGAGKLFLIAAGCGHRCRSLADEGHSYRAMSFAPHALTAMAPALLPSRPIFASPLLNDSQAAHDLDAFFRCLPGEPATRARRRALAERMAGHLARHAVDADAPPQERDAVRRAVDVIEASPAAPLRLADLADHACLSPHHFQRVFLAHTGVSPREFQLLRRVRLGRALLDRGVSVADAAARCGFADQAHFTKAFKRVVGVPPGRYLRHNLPANAPDFHDKQG